MIALLGRGGRLDRVVVVDQFGIPLVGLAAKESVEALEPTRQRPVPFGGGKAGLLQWGHVPLTEAVGVVPALGKHLRDQRAVIRDTAIDAGESLSELLNHSHPHRCRVATGEQRRPGGRTQCGGVELGQSHAAFGDARHGRHIDQPAETVPGRDADVVPDQIEHVGRVRRRSRWRVRRPIRFGVANIESDFTCEGDGHGCGHYPRGSTSPARGSPPGASAWSPTAAESPSARPGRRYRRRRPRRGP